MANCLKCGAELFETSKFCPECGAPVEKLSDPVIAEADGPEAAAEILEAAAEKALEDIPDIKKIDMTVAEIKEEAEKSPVISDITDNAQSDVHSGSDETPAEKNAAEDNADAEDSKSEEKEEAEKKDDFSDFGAFDKSEFDADLAQTTDSISTEPKSKKSKGAVIAAVIVIIALCIAAFVFLKGGFVNDSDGNIAESITTAAETDVTVSAAETEITVTEVSEDAEPAVETSAAESSEAVTTAVSEETTMAESSVTEESSAAEESSVSESESAAMISEDVIFEPEHKAAIGSNVSAECSLSEAEISTDMFNDNTLIIAEYSSDVNIMSGNPVVMVMRIGDTNVDVNPSSASDTVVVYEYTVMKANAEAAGFTAADIDSLAFRSSGAPVDVFRITISQN